MPSPGIPRRLALTVTASLALLPVLARARSTPLGYTFSGAAEHRDLGLAPASDCTGHTRRQTEGPYYTPQTPRRTSLRESDTTGEPLILQGLVLSRDCRPLAGAVIDIWHCDENGRYDNAGFRYRGHQFTDADGAFRFETIRPGRYAVRTPHIHVKVQGEETPVLTTQVYFPDMADANKRDGIYRESLAMRLERSDVVWLGRFDFVLPAP